VSAGYCQECEVQISYAIGVAKPTSIHIETFGTHRIPVERIQKLVGDHFDPRPGAIIRELNLRQPIYAPLSAYGHFGRDDLDLPWESTNKVEELLEDCPL